MKATCLLTWTAMMTVGADKVALVGSAGPLKYLRGRAPVAICWARVEARGA